MQADPEEEQELEYTRLNDWLTAEQVKVTLDFPSGGACGYTDSFLQKGVPRVSRTNAWHCKWNAHKYTNQQFHLTTHLGSTAQALLHLEEGLPAAGGQADHDGSCLVHSPLSPKPLTDGRNRDDQQQQRLLHL